MKHSAIVFLATLILPTAFASEFMEYSMDDYKAKESKWQFDVGANYLKYPTTLPAFEGKYYETKKVEDQEIVGPQLSIGRDFHLGKGISVTAKAGGFYLRVVDKEIGQAARDINIDLASTRRDHLAYGGNGSMSLNYIFEGKTLDFQPHVFAGVGVGRAHIEREYQYNGKDVGEKSERYDVEIDDTFSFRETGLGLNIISKKGLVTYIRASRTVLALNSRELKGTIQETNRSERKISEKQDKNQEHEVNSAAIGLGFLF